MNFYSIKELPGKGADGGKIFETLGNQNFLLVYDFRNTLTIIGLGGEDPNKTKNKLINEIPGIGLSSINFQTFGEELIAYPIYRKIDEFDRKPFCDVFDIIPDKGFIAILFVNISTKEIDSVKTHLEDVLSAKIVRETEYSKMTSNNRAAATVQRDLYRGSEEKLMLDNIVGSLNKSILSNGLAYRIFLIAPNENEQLHEYINTHFLVLNKYNLGKCKVNEAIDYLSNRQSLAFGIDYAKEFVNFYGSHNINHTLPTLLPLKDDGIEIGKFMKDGILETDFDIRIDPSALNLGFIITGLPGSGKTREAMFLIDSILKENRVRKTAVFIITPTKEWKEFALAHNMYFIKLYDDNTPINFFRCPKTIEAEKFYGNLAMILSSAANAGPYRNPIEKCLLNAFRKVYIEDLSPEPTRVYDEIEESIIKYHGKRTSNDVKYTKHGENIKSALENLRGILSMQQYSVREGVKFEDFLENGAIFDISSASVNTKMQLYALVLNQIYALAANFDEKGDNELRLVLCLEEAQTIFGDATSPAVQDVKQRIQDFRKQGIGLMLLTHNVTDIEVGIRRLCQLKLYLKQAPDTALIASKDLIFTTTESEDVVLKLKTLGSQIGACSYISKIGKEKRQQDTIFLKTGEYEPIINTDSYNPLNYYVKKLDLDVSRIIESKIAFRFGTYEKLKSTELDDSYSIRLFFLGEELAKVKLNKLDSTSFPLLENKEYKIQILNKKKLLKEFTINASKNILLDIKEISL